MKNKEQQEGRILSVEIRDVESGELLKAGTTNGIVCIYATKEETNCFAAFEGVNALDLVEILLGLQNLADKIESKLKKQTSVETLEVIKALIKKENSEVFGKEGD